MKDKTSIVIANYNGLNYLKRTSNPLINLNYHNFEIIIVDNGSTDRSIDYIKNLSKKYKNINLLISPVNKSKNFTVNYGTQNSKNDYILFLDNDVIITEKNILNDLLNYYNKFDSIGCLGCHLSQSWPPCNRNSDPLKIGILTPSFLLK